MALAGHSLEAEPTADRVSEVQVVVLDILRIAGPLTHDQLVALYDGRADAYPGVPKASPQSIRSRVAELVHRGLVVAVDKAGKSSYGRPATRWALTIRKEAA